MADFAKATTAKHKAVLLKESIDGLDLKNGETFVDGTYGAGGHTREVLRRFPGVRTISLDQDPNVGADITGNFREIDKLLGETRPDAILLDIGLSSDQIDPPTDGLGRGFSFLRDEPLDMRMSQKGTSATDILNSWDESAIELILRGFGEEKYSRRIAHEIVRRRELKPFETTSELVETISASIPQGYKRSRIHPATRTFQALRIAVNEELTALEEGLEKAFFQLKTGGRLAVITFHSLEDRIVKNFFREKVKEESGELMNKKPIIPSEAEVRENPRSRSAKLRIIKKYV